MPVTNTKVGLANEALLLLGSGTITDFAETTDKAQICSKLYEGVIANLLSARTWNFTKAKKQLSRLVTAPINGWRYSFQLPSDMVSGPWAVYPSTQVGAQVTRSFEIFEDKLLANDPVIVIDYQLEPNVNKFTAAFHTLVVNALAAVYAVPIADQPELAKYYDQLAFGLPSDNRMGGQFRIAANADNKASPQRPLPADEVIAARLA